MSASAPSVFTAPFADRLFDVLRLPGPDPAGEGAPSDTLSALGCLLDTHADSIAAVIVEPRLQGAGGMRVWDDAVLRAIRSRTTACDILLIADEVLTGFGRTGPLFACLGAGIVPDMMCLSKGLTGGFLPLGATVVTDRLFEAFRSTDRRRTLFHGHSFTANPLACAAARASLALLDDACTERRAAIEAEQRAHLSRLAAHPWVRRPRVLGTIAAFDLEPVSPSPALPATPTATGGYLDPIGQQLAAFALDAGVLIRPLGNVVYTLPPYSITTDQLAKVYLVIEQFLTDADHHREGSAARAGAAVV